MLKNQFDLNLQHNQLTSQAENYPNIVIPLETQNGLKIINPITKVTRLLSFDNEQINFDWNNFLEISNKRELKKLSFTILMEDDQQLRLYGDYNLLSSIYEFTAGKYIFRRGTIFLELKSLKKDHNQQVRVIVNQQTGQKYYEKVILTETNQISEELQMSSQTLGDFSSLPEEIQIILELQRIYTPHLIRVDSVLYDGNHYSYIYQNNKNLIELKVYYNSLQQEKQMFLIHIAKQLLQLLLVLEEKSIVLPSIHHKNIYINPETHEIILTDYDLAFYCNKKFNQGATIGYASPEYFKVQTQVCSKANNFQVGVLLYYILFGQSPYGKDQQEIIKNTLKLQLDLSMLDKENNQNFDFIRQLLELNQQKRPTAKEVLKNSIFSFANMLLISKALFKLSHTSNQVMEEFQNFNQTSEIQKVKTKIGIVIKILKNNCFLRNQIRIQFLFLIQIFRDFRQIY